MAIANGYACGEVTIGALQGDYGAALRLQRLL
jgi:hypothetical protein